MADAAMNTADGDDVPMLDTLDIIVLTVALATALYFLVKKFSGPTEEERPASTVVSMADRPDDSDLAAKMKRTNKKLVVFFGSQTGTAEEYASRLVVEAKSYGLRAMAADMQDYDGMQLCELQDEVDDALAVFLMATYGEGDPTDNAQEFFDLLQTCEESDEMDLKGLRFAVFGLGNKTYEHFNSVGRFVDKMLGKFGGTRVTELGEGDDDADIEDDFAQWREKFWARVCDLYDIDPDSIDIDSQRQYELKTFDHVPKKVFVGEPAMAGTFKVQKRPFTQKNPYLAPLTVKRELFNDTDRSCLHIEIDIKGSGMRYTTGDHVAIYPKNPSSVVDAIGERCRVDLDQVISLLAMDPDEKKKSPFPCPCTYRTALTFYVDVISPPKLHVVRELAQHTEDPKEKEFLLRITSKEGKREYSTWVVHDGRSLVQILEQLPSVNPPLDVLLEMLPRLQPRYYSISSSPKQNPDSIHVTAAIVRYTTPLGVKVSGICTSYLEAETTMAVPVFVRSSTFRLPPRQTTPIVMIGPGTGLAPFRGFLQERNYAREKGVEIGDTVLFFGCQNRAKHFLYESELQEYQNNGSISDLHLAFSRDQAEKVYVQHKLLAAGETVWKLLKEKRGHLYVCGDAKHMARDVSHALTKIAMQYGGMTEQNAVNWFKDLRKRNRYCEDVWS